MHFPPLLSVLPPQSPSAPIPNALFLHFCSGKASLKIKIKKRKSTKHGLSSYSNTKHLPMY